eukprot:TRINITY_DN2497_c0_g1_i2.p1 TRINITY_DN2497_c0_g1~~TRINITY_DN2497_c0_g1_i2.p1  ORF type:complete len:357 (+),score=78.23 TRINITY_DN2497_c0_g1_i2:155-1072(+)
MHIMVRFYQKGTDTKKKQMEDVISELEKLEIDEKMINEQLEALAPFPPIHPKKQTYVEEIEKDLENLTQQKNFLLEEKQKFERLHLWSKGIVEAVTWLETNLEEYCNKQYGSTLTVPPVIIAVTPDQYRAYKKGLDEITYNLQESQDFFDASMDGRLQRFHQLEKCMIEAQLKALSNYPSDNLRRQAVEKELLKDLEYVKENMNVNPKVEKHREQMRQIHRDFFAVLKWQREKLAEMGYNEVIEQLKGGERGKETDIEERVESKEPIEDARCPEKDGNTGSGDSCPIKEEEKAGTDFSIHGLYDK